MQEAASLSGTPNLLFYWCKEKIMVLGIEASLGFLGFLGFFGKRSPGSQGKPRKQRKAKKAEANPSDLKLSWLEGVSGSPGKS